MKGDAMRQLISSGSTFEAEIGYSRAVAQGPWVFVSGTTGFDYATMSISSDLGEQTEQCLQNIAAALEQAGASLRDVVRVTWRGVPRVLADPAQVLRGGPPGGDDDLGWPRRSQNEDRDRGHGAQERVMAVGAFGVPGSLYERSSSETGALCLRARHGCFVLSRWAPPVCRGRGARGFRPGLAEAARFMTFREVYDTVPRTVRSRLV
jgi:hypothetical protein